MGRARDEASRLHHEYIGTEHILLGIAGEASGAATETLTSLGIGLDPARSSVAALIGMGPMSATPDDRGVTPRAKRALEFAHEEATRRGSHQVEPEHLLIGVTREVQGVGAQIIRNMVASPEKVYAKMADLLDDGPARR